MLKNIRLHIEQDEEKQEILETQLAQHIYVTQRESINAFQRQIPSLVPIISQIKSQNISLFCNKFGKFNIVDYGLGRVLYGFDPEQEVLEQANQFFEHSPYINILDDASSVIDQNEPLHKVHLDFPSYQQFEQYSPLPEKVDLLVVLGLGLGFHIKHLLLHSDIKYLIIYEPELQYFSSSSMVTSWREILDIAKAKNTTLFFQLQKDGRDIIKDVAELQQHADVSGFYLYQHYNSPVFSSLSYQLKNQPWRKLRDHGLSLKTSSARGEFEPLWMPPIVLSQYSTLTSDNEKFQNNLAAFKKYFPDIYTEFFEYQPETWIPVVSESGRCNLINKKTLNAWYGNDPIAEAKLSFDSYSQYPNKDGLVLGYKGTKLRHYLHYKFVIESESLLEKLHESEGALPQTIKSIILFGVGLGYQLEEMQHIHQIEKLFLCEPNRDFFYASLFAIDWAKILDETDQKGYRIYINIGDDGAHLFRDLLNQFYAIGPYNLAHTYFYQSYYNAALNSAIGQLREQLQIVISMGEYFDHAFYGINQTVEGLSRGYAHLTSNPHKKLNFESQECPVFILGNGPSLDYSIEVIKEFRDRAIVVSCGTSLQVLHKHGITPDFHAEIEQNRSTYDWAVRLGCLDYLKEVVLLSCNGIHPDTCSLYKDVLIAFKDGESSTVSNLRVLGEQNYATLKFAFPTVSNFALNLFKTLGFKQLYLFGIDLGFVDKAHHHSKSSGYYDETGAALYDYDEKNNTALIVPGNFRKVVNTKHEFKVSKVVMEDLLRDFDGDCYNTSDGARISATVPLNIDDLLILSQPSDKEKACEGIMQETFQKPMVDDYRDRFFTHYDKNRLAKELAVIGAEISKVREGEEDIHWLIDYLKNTLFSSYAENKSLLFYYLYGTINFANAFLLKLSFASDTSQNEALQQALDIVLKRFTQFSDKINSSDFSFDVTSSFSGLREREYLRKLQNPPIIPLVKKFAGVTQHFDFDFSNWFEIETSRNSMPEKGITLSDDIELLNSIALSEQKQLRVLGLVTNELNWSPQYDDSVICSKVIPLPSFSTDDQAIRAGRLPVMNMKMYAVLLKKCYLCTNNPQWIIPRFDFVIGNQPASEVWLQSYLDALPAYDYFIQFPTYIAIPRDGQDDSLVDSLGNRGELICSRIGLDNLSAGFMSESEYRNISKIFIE
ncbi:6-hydroxymethylpterin diphosphokinase MptE-like protein [Aliiglaciecola sp. LCG003]|uniref:6-hydroxymethylpterin diphosphokinase MptE-like protein n=1 Tax=Aliiglaciecola sp. LCG003 TaxID=3053655 RepID=UPI00257381E2|nr:6-hydroxymethylpterin diphosphokinase MptE-like protein [Aliiglaciecola sp. LCG003]WJG10577.1 DUF115 domain-containing protein [Aliiglaciecola sp. LCG003]